jgi:hypothetical protein
LFSESETKKIEGVRLCHKEKTITKKQKVTLAEVEQVARVVIRVAKVANAGNKAEDRVANAGNKAEDRVAARTRAPVEADRAAVRAVAAAAERSRGHHGRPVRPPVSSVCAHRRLQTPGAD